MHKVTLIPGDGIGPSIMEAAVHVLEATGVRFEWDRQIAGMAAYEAYQTPIPKETLDSIHKTRIAFKGPLTTPIGGGFRSVNVALRQEFNLYANVRPAISFEGTKTPFKNVNLITIRENTEGLYSGLEHDIMVEGKKVAAESIALITKVGSEKIIRFAFDYARQHQRKKVTPDLKPDSMCGTDEMAEEIVRRMV
ncbi:MAG: isocitrate/isopropylmalate family dehydrogenase [bacterium]